MSSRSLYVFLEKLDRSLRLDQGTGASATFRNEVVNLRSHTLDIEFEKVTKTLQDLLDSSPKINATTRYIQLKTDPKYIELYETFLKHTTTNFRTKATKLQKKKIRIKVTPSSSGLDLFVTVKVFSNNTVNIFGNVLKGAYTKPLQKFYEDVLELLGEYTLQRPLANGDSLNVDESGKATALEHKGHNANVIQYLNSKAYNAFKRINQQAVRSKEGLARVEKEDLASDKAIADLGINKGGTLYTVIKDLAKGFVTVETELGSFLENSIAGGSEGALTNKIRKEIDKIINKSGINMAELEGSDSLSQAKTKKIIDNTIDPFKKIQSSKVKVTKQDTKIKGKKTSATLKSQGPKEKKKVSRSRAGAITPPALKQKKLQDIRPSPAQSPLALIAQFNARLPQAVEAAMGSPALNYRTGRFASGVRVVDAITTPQGFTSYGYTYQLYPYQTFEPGYAQGSVERDPRPLIDRAMRDIAADFAIARFYTRRV